MVHVDRDYLSECIVEKGFAQHMSECFTELGMKRQEMAFFMGIADSEWAGDSAPFMYSRILEDAFELDELPTAESVARAFLERFPKNPLAWNVIGRMGEIYFRKGNWSEVVSTLSRIEKKGAQAAYPESYYFLGKARQHLHDQAGAEKDMSIFNVEVLRKGLNSPFEADAYLVRAEAMISRGDDKGAMSMYRAGYAVAGDEFRDAILYKMGELSEHLGDDGAARNTWELLINDGKDPLWKKMASDQLSELEWKAKWKNSGK
jgi:tetratricopeptide (TPR) repeat protein